MSKLARALTLAAMLAAMNLAGMTAVAQTHASDHATSRPNAQHQVTSQQQSTGDVATRAALAQERYYSTWGYGDTTTPAPAEPSRQPAWPVIALSVLAAVGRWSPGSPCWPPAAPPAANGPARPPDQARRQPCDAPSFSPWPLPAP
jgi:hypothetical protein